MKMSQHTIVERASAELTKRINGLRKHSSSSSSNNASSNNANSITNNGSIVGKTSVMERVTNVLCGGGSSSNNANNNNNSSSVHSNNTNNNNSIVSTQNSTATTTATSPSINNTPEKPYRYQSKHQHNNLFSHHTKGNGGGGGGQTNNNLSNQTNSNQSTPQSMRKYHQKPQTVVKRFVPLATPILAIDQLFLDERFLQLFLLYFTSYERRDLAQVCSKWRDILYRNPIYYSGLVPVLQCRELRMTASQDKVKLYNSIIRRGFHSIALNGATDEDALDIVHSFPLASKHIHSLSLRCSSISDRGLEALLDHLQVSLFS